MRFSVFALRITAWSALACHVLVTSGLPLPLANPSERVAADAGTRVAGKDRSRPFPCMDKPCGCASAEQCFASCCCHTPAERLAWARAHDVEPAVLAALERRFAKHAAPPAGRDAVKRRAPSCRATGESPALDLDGPDVCRDYRSLAADPAPPPPADEDVPAAPGPRTVILRDMLACGGIVTAWLACGLALPPPRVAAPTAVAPAGRLATRDVVVRFLSADLSTPPPRVA